MKEQELISKLNRVLVIAESDRILAVKRGNSEKAKKCYELVCRVGEIRDKIAEGNGDERLKEEAMQIIAQHLIVDRIKLQRQGVKVRKPKNFLFYIMDKLFGNGKMVKEEDNNSIKK